MEKISRILPKVRRYALDRIPTIEEIREIVDAADIRGKALTLVLVSSGIREGAIENLKMGDYSTIKNNDELMAGRLIVYAGESEQYSAFITLEACIALEKYLQFRREHGKDVKNDSPLFRETFDPVAASSNKNWKVNGMTAHAIRQYYNRLLRSIGIRKERKRRHEFSVHSLRKWFKTKAEMAGMKPINVEIIMGHSVGISDSYYRPLENILTDYLSLADIVKHLWSAIEIVRHELRQPESTIFVLMIAFFKHLNDTFEENASILEIQGKGPGMILIYTDFLFLLQLDGARLQEQP